MIWTAVRAVLRGLVLAGLSVVGALAVLLNALILVMIISVGLMFLIPPTVGLGRWAATTRRRLAARWDSVVIPQPYQPPPAPPQPDVDGFFVSDNQLYRTPRWPVLASKIDWMLNDRATWRDMGWAVLNVTIGNVLALAPAALIGYGALNLPWGGLLIVTGFLIAPPLMRLHTTLSVVPLSAPRRGFPRSVSRRWTAVTHTMALLLWSVLSLVALAAHLSALALLPVSPGTVKHGREMANRRRELAGKWGGEPVARPYLSQPRAMSVYRDAATWRDLLFFVLDPIVGVVLTVLPTAALIYAGWGFGMPQMWRWLAGPNEPDWGGGWYGQFAGSDWLAFPAAVALAAFGLWLAPYTVKLNAKWVRMLLSPTKQATLALRVQELTVTRTEATDAQAAELRRIERDLHDGAQARLVAMGLGLGALERLIDSDPAAAKAMLAKVRDNSAKALVELRDLVRGIHPPVLADRGLGDAVRALALDTPLPVQVHVNLPHRLDPSVESAAYFAISEALTNATKHAQANAASVEVALDDQTLRMTVRDNGRGGADASRGTGLRGIERRLSAFDGAMTVHSPVGGPTTVEMALRVGVIEG